VRTKADISKSMDQACDLSVSALTGEGLAELRARIGERLGDRAVSVSGEMLALTPRHATALSAARQALEEAIRRVERQKAQAALNGPEVIAAALRTALDELAGLGGRMTPDEVIGRVFSRFCVGK
jgi:tRNA modification GTPase